MNNEELLAVLRLQATKNIGDIISKKLINHFNSPSEIFEAKRSSLLKIDGIGAFIVNQLLDTSNIEKAEEEFAYILSLIHI